MILSQPSCHRCRKSIQSSQLVRALLIDEERTVDIHAGCVVLSRGRYRRL
jgi:hypothetical protein